MRRRDFLWGAAATAAGTGLCAPWSWAKRKRVGKSTRPNILMVSIDDMKPWIGPQGFAEAHTPTFDELAKRGLLFARAYCAAPACSPSRAAVFTGLAPHTSGTYNNGHSWREKTPNVVTFPRLIRESGYFTAGFGKLFHIPSHDDRRAWDHRRHYNLHRMPGAPLSAPKGIYRRSGSRFDWAALDISVEEMDDHKQVNRAVRAMKRRHEGPWFVAVGLFRPHLPWYAPKRFFDLYPPDQVPMPVTHPEDLDDVPKMGRRFAKTVEHDIIEDAGLWRDAVRAYLASISYVDYELGRLLAETPSDTLVIIWSDHGWHLGSKKHWHKYALWEEAAQTVFAMAGPSVSSGVLSPRTVSLNDIYPTLCDICELSAPHELAGQSLTSLLSDPRAPWDRPALTTWRRGNHSVRSERFRYIRYRDGGEELYDHDRDPHEWYNLADSDRAQPIIEAHARWLPGADDAPAPDDDGDLGWLELGDSRRALTLGNGLDAPT